MVMAWVFDGSLPPGHEAGHHVNGEREDDGGVFLSRHRVQGLEQSSLIFIFLGNIHLKIS